MKIFIQMNFQFKIFGALREYQSVTKIILETCWKNGEHVYTTNFLVKRGCWKVHWIKSPSPPWPYSGHRPMSGIWTMSEIWPVLTVHIPDIKFWIPEYGSDITNIFCPYSGHLCPHSRHQCPYSRNHCPYSGHHFFLLSIFWTSTSDVRYMDRENCLYSGHWWLMSGIRPVFTVHIPDIKIWCLDYGQFLLSKFRTSIFS